MPSLIGLITKSSHEQLHEPLRHHHTFQQHMHAYFLSSVRSALLHITIIQPDHVDTLSKLNKSAKWEFNCGLFKSETKNELCY